jgi:hypothetical protein
MPTTPKYALPYPAPSDPADVPTDMGKLANAVDSLAMLGYWTSPVAGTIRNSADTIVQMMRAAAGAQAVGIGTPADTVERLRIMADGSLNWGPGNAATDTTLYRHSAGVVRTGGQLYVDSHVFVNLGDGTGRLYFGSAGDTSLYRSSANLLRTPGGLQIDVNLLVNGSIYNRNDSGHIYFGTADDTSLYRSAADTLKTDDNLVVGGTITRKGAWVDSFFIYETSDTQPRFTIHASGQHNWGAGATSAVDTNLYRAGGGELKTDGGFTAAGPCGSLSWIAAQNGATTQVRIGDLGDTLASIAFGSDTNPSLRRTGSGDLAFYGNRLFIGSQADVYLNRSGSPYLGTNGGMSIDLANAAYRLYFGNAADTYLYRPSASLLRTNAAFQADGNINGADVYTDNWSRRAVWGPSTSYKFRLIGNVASFTTDANGQASIGYGQSGITGVIAVVVTNNNSAHANVFFSAMGVGTTGFTIQAWNWNNTALANTACTVSWIAYLAA